MSDTIGEIPVALEVRNIVRQLGFFCVASGPGPTTISSLLSFIDVSEPLGGLEGIVQMSAVRYSEFGKMYQGGRGLCALSYASRDREVEV